MIFPRPSLTVDAVVLCGEGAAMRLLVIERARAPHAGAWALPGGFVDEHEHPFRACLREAVEETGLDLTGEPPRALSLRARKGRDPRGWTVSQPYLFHLPQPAAVTGADDARRAVWVPLAELDTLAFDHGAMLCEALGRFWPFMPGTAPGLETVHGFGCPDAPPDRLAFYGGSFNPLHPGHTACVAAFPEPHTLVVVPDSNPFKDAADTRCAWRQYRALRAAFPDVLGVYPGFCGMEVPNPTYLWLPRVAAREKALLIGDDSLAALPRWLHADTLAAALSAVYVVPRRAPADALAAAAAWLRTHHPACRLFHLPDHPHRDESSTRLRDAAGPQA